MSETETCTLLKDVTPNDMQFFLRMIHKFRGDGTVLFLKTAEALDEAGMPEAAEENRQIAKSVREHFDRTAGIAQAYYVRQQQRESTT